MLARLSNWLSPVAAILYKEILCEFRTRYAISMLSMFAVVTLSAISMTIAGNAVSQQLSAVLLWIIIFFSAMAGLSRVFVQEQESGTLFTLRAYIPAQAVFCGKLIFNILLLLALCFLIVPLAVVFLDMTVGSWVGLVSVVASGAIGMAAISTLTAALVAQTQGKGSLFTVLTFPVLLPQFLASIQATSEALAGSAPAAPQLIFLLGYDIAIIIAGSILFDYLWQD